MDFSRHFESPWRRVARSWRLLGASWRLVASERSLRRFVLGAALVWIALVCAYFGLIFLALRDGDEWDVLVLTLASYYPFSLVSVAIGVALLASVDGHLRGEPMTVGGIMGVIRARAGQIAAWAALAAGVGVILDQVVQRIPGGGRLARAVLGEAWATVTLFAVPILATEGCSVGTCLRRSAQMFRERWGEAVAGSLSIFAVLVVATVRPALRSVTPPRHSTRGAPRRRTSWRMRPAASCSP